MRVVVVGGTGLIGSQVVQDVRDAGHEVVVAAPSTGVDTLSGAGVDEALAGAEAVVIVTEWKQFKGLDPVATAAKVTRPVVFDGRNILDPEAWKAAGWTYTGMGR